jgi:hypothetical protein
MVHCERADRSARAIKTTLVSGLECLTNHKLAFMPGHAAERAIALFLVGKEQLGLFKTMAQQALRAYGDESEVFLCTFTKFFVK